MAVATAAAGNAGKQAVVEPKRLRREEEKEDLDLRDVKRLKVRLFRKIQKQNLFQR